ncbi:MAG: lysophospholipid acyltransferase family protein [Prevotella sp.]|nr:lysophospholipid acyltransferase family protein [Prevotella sp.]
MSKILYYIGYAIWYVLSLLPLRVLYVLSDLLYWLVSRVVRYRHRVIWNNLQTSFPEKTPQELRQIQRGFYHYFCDYLVETIKLMTISERQLRRRMTFTGTDELNEVLNSGQSCAVFLGHVGNWEWITSLPFWVSSDVQCAQIYHPLENPSADRLFLKVRERLGAKCIAMNDTLREVVRYRREGRTICVGYISDQKPHWVNIHHWVDFLNHDTPVLTGTERIARSTGHAVFYADVTRLSRGHYNCEMRLITRDPKSMGEWELTDIYFRELEATICRNPAIWLWSHNRWKRTREEFNRRFEVKDGKVIRRSLTPSPSPKGEGSK